MKKIISVFVALFGVIMVSSAQNINVSGLVLDTYGEPISGASVFVVGTNIVAFTNLDGEFFISAPPTGVLEVSCLGYENATKPINNKTTIYFVLHPYHGTDAVGTSPMKENDEEDPEG